jgi:dihydroorotase
VTSIYLAGARVIDPSQNLDAEGDVLVADGQIASIGESAKPPSGAEVVDGSGLILTPGLVDIHTHFFYGLTSMAIDPRTAFGGSGITAAADAGTSGAANFMNLKTFILEPSAYRLFAFVNLYVLGFAGGPGDSPRYLKGVPPLDLALVDQAARIIARNREYLVGVKMLAPREGSEITGLTGEMVRRAVEIAETSGTRVMCHVDGGEPLSTVVGPMRAGDIITHCYHGKTPNIIGDDGRVRPEILDARARGILFDFAPADWHHFSWSVLEAAVSQGFWPDTISTDTATAMKGDPPFATMPDCMSMFLDVGMPLTEVVAAATTRPAAAIGKEKVIGSLAPGRVADITLLRLIEAPKTYRSMREGESRTVKTRLAPLATMTGGEWLWTSDDLSSRIKPAG